MSVRRDYAGNQEMPLGAYAGFVAAFGLGLGALLWRARRKGVLPERVPPWDAVIAGLATHKLTRIVTKDWVTSPFRAPFARYEARPSPQVKRSLGRLEPRARASPTPRALPAGERSNPRRQ